MWKTEKKNGEGHGVRSDSFHEKAYAKLAKEWYPMQSLTSHNMTYELWDKFNVCEIIAYGVPELLDVTKFSLIVCITSLDYQLRFLAIYFEKWRFKNAHYRCYAWRQAN